MTHIAPHNQDFRRYQIVARMGKAGHFRMNGRKFIIWKYMTFFTGHAAMALAGEFSRPAMTDEKGFLVTAQLQEGEILVTPGLIYKKIPMSGLIMAEHLRRMKTFKPRDIVVHEKDTAAGAVDLGTIDLRTKH